MPLLQSYSCIFVKQEDLIFPFIPEMLQSFWHMGHEYDIIWIQGEFVGSIQRHDDVGSEKRTWERNLSQRLDTEYESRSEENEWHQGHWVDYEERETWVRLRECNTR